MKKLVGINSLRFFAIALIVAYHLFRNILPGGFVAVEIFFCLSGFLIAGKLVQNVLADGGFKYGSFILGRLKRLYPTLIFCVLLTLALGLMVNLDILTGARTNTLGALTFTTNFFELFSGGAYENTYLPNVFEHTWFLALIFQFYLIVPLIMKLFLALIKNRKNALKTFGVSMIVLGIISWVLMFFYGGIFGMPDRAYFALDSHMTAFCFGAAFAVFSQLFPRPPRTTKRLAAIAMFASLGAILVLAFFLHYDNPLTFMFGFHAVTILTLIIIACVIKLQRNIRERHKTNNLIRIIESTGNLAYGIYLFHWPLYILLPQLLPADTEEWGYVIINISLSIVLASIIYNVLRIKNLRRKFIKQPLAARIAYVAIAVALVATSTVTLIRAPRVSSIAEQLSQNADQQTEKVISTASKNADYLKASQLLEQTTKTLSNKLELAKSTQSEVDPNSVVTVTSANDADVLVIGDSVTLGAKAAIESTISKSYVDAKESRGIETATGLIAGYAASGHLAKTIVISLATNERNITELTLRDIVNVAGNDHDFVLITAYAGPLQPREKQNAALKAFADSHQNVYLADWWSIAHNNWSLMYADHIHLNPEGRTTYANMLSNVLKGVRK